MRLGLRQLAAALRRAQLAACGAEYSRVHLLRTTGSRLPPPQSGSKLPQSKARGALHPMKTRKIGLTRLHAIHWYGYADSIPVAGNLLLAGVTGSGKRASSWTCCNSCSSATGGS